ncbi:hypothetical protein [Pseudonocardia sp. NPDC049635]|uniref:hypothetical protein n=1 Tax=Pseudonocardia sp. NPDC049635 TaxID=3155506 RepID=UPI0033CC2BFA
MSVAELLARHSAGAREHRHEAGPLTGPVLSVGDLLRREGRSPAAGALADVPATGAPGGWPDIDLPQPLPASAAAQEWAERPAAGRRRAGAVAGALIAAGSVLGAAIYNGAASHPSDAQAAADGLFPGVGLPSSAQTEALPGQYLPANVALQSPLENLPSTAPGATDWMEVAFPQQAGVSTAAGTVRQVSTGSGPSAAAAVPVQRTPEPAGRGAGLLPGVLSPASPSTSTADPGTGSTATGSPIGAVPLVAALNNPSRPPATNLIEPLTAPGPGQGGTSTGPVQDVTEVARPVGSTVGGVVAPVAQAAAPVGETLGSTLSPVTAAVTPVTEAVQPVTRPLTDTLEPVTTPVLGALSPITEPVLSATEPLTGPVLEAAAPVTSLLDTSAKQGSGDGSDRSRGARDGSDGGSARAGSGSEATQPLQAVTKPVGATLGAVTEPVGSVLSGVTEPVGGALGGVTEGVGSLLGG